MASSSNAEAADRSGAYGQHRRLTPVDRFGIWLSARALRAHVPSFTGKRVGDFGCGYDARFVRSVLDEVGHATLVDVALAPDLKGDRRVTAIEGTLPDAVEAVADDSLDVVLCISVLEHLWDPVALVRELRRVAAPGGSCLINVPSWRGKRFLEFSAFRLGLSPAEEIRDHKTYYDPAELAAVLVEGGFRRDEIDCRRHKFGLNTFAVCRISA
jgi:SAM-dependent methyltransferase